MHYKSLSGGADPDQEGIDLRMSAIKHKILVVSGKGGNLCILSTVLIEWMTHQKNRTIYNMCSCCRSWQIHCCSSAQYGIITDEKVGRFLLWKSSWGQQHRPFVANKMAQDIVEVYLAYYSIVGPVENAGATQGLGNGISCTSPCCL